LLTERAPQLSPPLLVMEANTIFNCSKTMEVISLKTFAFLRMLATKAWQNSIRTARRLSRNPNTTR